MDSAKPHVNGHIYFTLRTYRSMLLSVIEIDGGEKR